jgi:activator of HSP90 ATPase
LRVAKLGNFTCCGRLDLRAGGCPFLVSEAPGKVAKDARGSFMRCWRWISQIRERVLVVAGLSVTLIFAMAARRSVTGDCVIHLRKGRLWPLCDLNVAMAIKGTCKKDGQESPITGTIVFPEITMDDRDDLQVQASTSSRGAASEVFGRWLRKEGYKAAEQAVQNFLDALDAKAGQDKPPEDAAEKVKSALAAAEKMAQVNRVMAADIPTPMEDAEDQGEPTGRLELQEEFLCSAVDVYDCLTVASRINAYSRCSDTVVELRVGGRFSMFGGKTTGGFEEIAHGGHLKCKWRMADWKPGQFSDLRIDLHDRGAGEGCALELVQSNIPAKRVEAVQDHWREYVFNQVCHRRFVSHNLET